jgi:hypothetical protein
MRQAGSPGQVGMLWRRGVVMSIQFMGAGRVESGEWRVGSGEWGVGKGLDLAQSIHR